MNIIYIKFYFKLFYVFKSPKAIDEYLELKKRRRKQWKMSNENKKTSENKFFYNVRIIRNKEIIVN